MNPNRFAPRLRSVAAAGVLALSAHATSAQVLELAMDASPVGLDPHLVTAFQSFMVVNGTIYEGLTAIDKDLRVRPGLAESWSVSADGKTYTFRIRRGVSFHNGAAMDARDAAASLRRVMSKDISSPLASRLAAVEQISTPDNNTVVVALKEPSAPLLVSLATLAIVPRNFENDKDSLQRQPMGTGPFKFREWQTNNFIALDKHAGYWRTGSPKVDGVKFSIVPESATRQVGLGSGQYAMLPNIDAATAMQVRNRPNVQLRETLELAYSLIGMNVSRPPFNDVRVRQALNYALNRAEIVQAALFGAGVPGGPLSPALKDWALNVSEYPCYAHNPQRAMELLKAAGHNAPLAVTLTVLPRQDIKDMAQVVQQQLNKAGFKVELKNPELGQFIQDWRNSNFDLFASTNAGSPDPDDYFFRTFRTGGSTNVFKYTNPELDGMLDRARAGTDEAVRKRNYAQVQRMLACDGPIAHVAYGQLFTAMRNNVQGFDIIANRSLSSLGGVSLAR